MKALAILALALAVSGCGWKNHDVALAVGLTALMSIDHQQTSEVVTNDLMREINPIMGGKPSQQQVNWYFAGALATKLIVAHILPEKYRTTWLAGWFGVSTAAVSFNHLQGIK